MLECTNAPTDSNKHTAAITETLRIVVPVTVLTELRSSSGPHRTTIEVMQIRTPIQPAVHPDICFDELVGEPPSVNSYILNEMDNMLLHFRSWHTGVVVVWNIDSLKKSVSQRVLRGAQSMYPILVEGSGCNST